MSSTILEVSRCLGLDKQFLYRYLVKHHKDELIVSACNNKTFLISDELKSSLYLELADKINEVHLKELEAHQNFIIDDSSDVSDVHQDVSDVLSTDDDVHQVVSSREVDLLEKVRALESEVSELRRDLRISEYQRGVIEGKYIMLKETYADSQKLIDLKNEELGRFKPILFGFYKKKGK